MNFLSAKVASSGKCLSTQPKGHIGPRGGSAGAAAVSEDIHLEAQSPI